MTEVNNERLEELLEGLEGVTPGPWGLFSEGRTLCVDPRGGDGRRPSIVDWSGFDQCDFPLKEQRKNAAHIARCDPDTIRALITELLSLRQSHSTGVRATVKPLEWMNHGPHDQTADSAVGQYRILVMDGDWVLFLPGIMPGVRYKSQVTAWTAAQADYERRILSALSPVHKDGEPPADSPTVIIGYTNWRGEYGEREIIPMRPWFGATDWHPEPQWLLKAWDVAKDAERDFALKDIGFVHPSKEAEVTVTEEMAK